MTANLALLLFAVAPFFDPVGQNFGIRWISLFLMFTLFVPLYKYKKRVPQRNVAALFFIIIIMPAHGLLMTFINGGIITSEFHDTSYLAFSILFFASLPIIFVTNIYHKYFKLLLCVSVAAGLLSIVLYSFSYNNNFDFISNYLTKTSIAIIAKRGIMGIEVEMIYFLATPLFFIPLAYFLNKAVSRRSYCIIAIVPLFALIASGTRSHIALSVLYVLWMIPNIIFERVSATRIAFSKFVFVGVGISSLLLFYDVEVLDFVRSPKRVELLSYYTDTFNNPITIFFGQGFNATAWDYALSEWTGGGAKLELTYLEYVRVFGIISFTVFVLFCGYIMMSLFKSKDFFEFHLLVLILINASINPYLISINGVVPLVLALGRINANKEK